MPGQNWLEPGISCIVDSGGSVLISSDTNFSQIISGTSPLDQPLTFIKLYFNCMINLAKGPLMLGGT